MKSPGEIVRLHFETIARELPHIREWKDDDSIHQFRVAVKRLRAFLRMMRSDASHPERLKLPRDFKEMYSHTGQIRDLQLLLKEMEIQKHLPDLDTIQAEMEALKKSNDMSLSRHEIKQIENKIVKDLPPRITADAVQEFVRQRIRSVKEINYKSDPSDAELHEVRKKLKDVLYILQLNNRYLQFDLPGSGNDELQTLKKLTDLLGELNDIVSATAHFNHRQVNRADQIFANYEKRREAIRTSVLSTLSNFQLAK